MPKRLEILGLAVIILTGVLRAGEKNDFLAEEQMKLELGLTGEVRKRALENLSGAPIIGDYLIMLSYFYDGEYEAAVKRMSRIPDAVSAKENFFMRLVPAVYDITRDFEQYDSGRFAARFKGKDVILKWDMPDVMGAALDFVKKEFGCDPARKILIEIYAAKKDFAVASTLGDEVLQRSGTVGICKFNRLMLISPRELAYGYKWQDTLVHEFIHYIINQLSGGKCPLWLHEGIAHYHETGWRADIREKSYLTRAEKAHLLEAMENDALIAFEAMHPSIVYLKDREAMSLAFAEVASLVDYLKMTFGKNVIPDLLKNLRGLNLEDAVKKTLGRDFDAVQSGWIEYVKTWPKDDAAGAVLDLNYYDNGIDEVKMFVGADMQGHVRIGDKFYKSGDYLSAKIQYEQALSEEPENPVILNKLAKVLIGQNEYEEAQTKLNESIASNPGYAASFVLLGDLYYEMGRNSEAVKMYRDASGINPFNYNVRKKLALLYFNLKDKENARVELEVCRVLIPDDPEIRKLGELPFFQK